MVTAVATSHNLRLAIIYRPQNDADVIRIQTSTFFSEFRKYLESVVMCEEQLIIVNNSPRVQNLPYVSRSIYVCSMPPSFFAFDLRMKVNHMTVFVSLCHFC